MGDFVIVAILVLIVVGAVYGTVRRIRYGSSCCGERTPADKKVKVEDKDKTHYPYTYSLNVEGMICSNCARHVENAFNVKAGMWAKVNLEKKEVLLRVKSDISERELAEIVASAGYTMISARRI